jgi:hypothetical protein
VLADSEGLFKHRFGPALDWSGIRAACTTFRSNLHYKGPNMTLEIGFVVQAGRAVLARKSLVFKDLRRFRTKRATRLERATFSLEGPSWAPLTPPCRAENADSSLFRDPPQRANTAGFQWVRTRDAQTGERVRCGAWRWGFRSVMAGSALTYHPSRCRPPKRW